MLNRKQRSEPDPIEIASPCSANWDEMQGDEKVRFCGQCRLNVYNLSAMDVEEAAAIVARDDDRLCLRFYRRADGTILTQDCPVGQQERARTSRRTVADYIAFTVGASLVVAAGLPVMGARPRPAAITAAIFAAARGNDIERLQSFLAAGYSPNRITPSGYTPLMAAARGGSIEATRLLLSHGADFRAKNAEGETALSIAQAGDHSNVAALLRKAGATE